MASKTANQRPHLLAMLLSDVVARKTRPAIPQSVWMHIASGDTNAWQRPDFTSFNRACSKGIGSATKHLSTLFDAEMSVTFALERVHRMAMGRHAKSNAHEHTDKANLFGLISIVHEIEPRLALWLMGMVGCELIQLLASYDEVAVDAMDSALDWIGGVHDRSDAPIGAMDVSRPADGFVSAVLQAMLQQKGRPAFMGASIALWCDRFSQEWADAYFPSNNQSGTVARSEVVVMRSARYRLLPPKQALIGWVIDSMIAGIMSYPARF